MYMHFFILDFQTGAGSVLSPSVQFYSFLQLASRERHAGEKYVAGTDLRPEGQHWPTTVFITFL